RIIAAKPERGWSSPQLPPQDDARADNSYRIAGRSFFIFWRGSMDVTYAATLVALLIFLASIVSVEAALSAAIIEIGAGVIAGNFLGLHPAPWMDFLAG